MKIEQLFPEITDPLAELVTKFSFTIWSFESFRKLVNFNSISQTEQDRIFNELQVTTLGLIILASEVEGFKKEFEKHLIKSFLKIYQELKIEPSLVQSWETLISLRLEEYRQDFNDAANMVENEKKAKQKKLDYKWALVETVTIDCLSHIRKGDVKKGDQLWSLLRQTLSTFYLSIKDLFDNPSSKKLLKDKVH